MRQRTWQNFTISKTELGRLIGRDIGWIDYGVKLGVLSRNKRGRFHLRTVLRQIEQHYRHSTEITISLASISQQRLAELLGVTRQTIHDWTVQGAPRNDDGSYDLKCVLRWLPKFYERLYRQRHKKKQ